MYKLGMRFTVLRYANLPKNPEIMISVHNVLTITFCLFFVFSASFSFCSAVSGKVPGARSSGERSTSEMVFFVGTSGARFLEADLMAISTGDVGKA